MDNLYDPEYKEGYLLGQDAWDSGRPMNPEDMQEFSDIFQEAYWDGFYDAQDGENIFYKRGIK